MLVATGHPEIRSDGDYRYPAGIGIPHLPCRSGIRIRPVNNRDDDIRRFKAAQMPGKYLPVRDLIAVMRIVTNLLGQVHLKEMG